MPPSEQERAIKAVALGALLGLVLALVARRRHRS
jgi:MYXO-CTERM domain-containing protein